MAKILSFILAALVADICSANNTTAIATTAASNATESNGGGGGDGGATTQSSDSGATTKAATTTATVTTTVAGIITYSVYTVTADLTSTRTYKTDFATSTSTAFKDEAAYHCSYLKKALESKYPSTACQINSLTKASSRADTTNVKYTIGTASTATDSTAFTTEFKAAMDNSVTKAALSGFGATAQNNYVSAKSSSTVTTGKCITLLNETVCGASNLQISLGFLMIAFIRYIF